MEWWNNGKQQHGILEEWNIGKVVFHKRRITQHSTIPVFQHSLGFQRSLWCSFFMQRSMTTFNPAFSAFSPASL